MSSDYRQSGLFVLTEEKYLLIFAKGQQRNNSISLLAWIVTRLDDCSLTVQGNCCLVDNSIASVSVIHSQTQKTWVFFSLCIASWNLATLNRVSLGNISNKDNSVVNNNYLEHQKE